jgi:hypothetical protein
VTARRKLISYLGALLIGVRCKTLIQTIFCELKVVGSLSGDEIGCKSVLIHFKVCYGIYILWKISSEIVKVYNELELFYKKSITIF